MKRESDIGLFLYIPKTLDLKITKFCQNHDVSKTSFVIAAIDGELARIEQNEATPKPAQ
jgi:hypothetical protein